MKYKLVLVSAVLVMMGCSDENLRIKGQFLSGCVQAGAPKSVCVCTFEKLEKKYSPAEMKAMNDLGGRPSEQFIRDMVASAQACRQK